MIRVRRDGEKGKTLRAMRARVAAEIERMHARGGGRWLGDHTMRAACVLLLTAAAGLTADLAEREVADCSTPLHAAAERGDSDAVTDLLLQSQDANADDACEVCSQSFDWASQCPTSVVCYPQSVRPVIDSRLSRPRYGRSCWPLPPAMRMW